MLKYPAFYADNIARGFDTEVGTPSMPTVASFKKNDGAGRYMASK